MTVTEMTVTEGPRCGQDHMTRSYDPVISVTVMPTLFTPAFHVPSESEIGYKATRQGSFLSFTKPVSTISGLSVDSTANRISSFSSQAFAQVSLRRSRP